MPKEVMMEEEEEESRPILAISDPVFSHTNDDGLREDFYSTIEQIWPDDDGNDSGSEDAGAFQSHRFSVGELCAVRGTGDGVKQLPWDEEKWVVGQILTLSKIRHSDDDDNDSSSQWQAKVRWLARWGSRSGENELLRYLKGYFDDAFLKQRIKRAKFPFRPGRQCLLETQELRTVPVACILPLEIEIKPSDDFINVDQIHPELEPLRAFFHCPLYHNGAKKDVMDVRSDWGSYSKLLLHFNKPTIPKPLRRGWDLLENRPLAKALEEWFRTKRKDEAAMAQSKSLASLKPAPANSKATKRKEDARARADSSLQPSKKKAKKSAPKKKTITKKKRTKDAEEDLTSSATTTTGSVDAQTLQDSRSKVSVYSSLDLNVSPLGNVLYEIAGRKRNDGVPLSFYQGVDLDYHDEHAAKEFRLPSKRRWRIRVGDILAFPSSSGCGGNGSADNKFSKSRRGKKSKAKNQVLPVAQTFTVPWHPGQVVSVFRRGDEGSNNFRMEVRWFDWPAELGESIMERIEDSVEQELFRSKLCSRMIIEIDEHINEVAVERALGYVVVTSNEKPPLNWLNNLWTKNGTPQVPLMCRFMQNTKDDDHILLRVDDWTKYGSMLEGPLSRLLLCPKAHPGKNSRLRKVYTSWICQRYKLRDGKLREFASPDDVDSSSGNGADIDKSNTKWTDEQINDANVYCDESEMLHRTEEIENAGVKMPGREFFQSITLSINRRRCVVRFLGDNSGVGKSMGVKIGDIVCIARNDAGKPSSKINGSRYTWSPFSGPWSVYQVLSIYRNTSQIASGTPSVLLEVRRFLRRSDLPSEVQSWAPPQTQGHDEELFFESDIVESDVAANRILGCALPLFAHFKPSEVSCALGQTEGVSLRVEFRCRHMFFSAVGRIQPLFCSDPAPLVWFNRMLERGFNASKNIQQDPSLRSIVEFCQGVSIKTSDGATSDPLLLGLMERGREEKPQDKIGFEKTAKGVRRSFYVSAFMSPPWATYAHADTICGQSNRKDRWWKVHVGDIVALKEPKDEDSISRTYPFTVPWKPCQVIAIFRDSAGDELGPLLLHVRWFSIKRDRETMGLEGLLETDQMSEVEIDASMLLGPLMLGCESNIAVAWNCIEAFLPVCPFLYSGRAAMDDKSSSLERLFRSIVVRGLSLSSLYSENTEKQAFLGALKNDLQKSFETGRAVMLSTQHFDETGTGGIIDSTSPKRAFPSPDSSHIAGHVWTTCAPFYTDKSSEVEFYSQVNVSPAFSDFAVDLRKDKSEKAEWTIRLGDVIIFRYTHCAGTAVYGGSTKMENCESKTFPMRCPWAVGEVVMITKPDLTLRVDGEEEDKNGISLEIRWFYRSEEIRGSAARGVSRNGEILCEEVFESDHYDIVGSESILAPALVYGNRRPVSNAKEKLGMPVLEFVCKRFWSVYRKSLIPCSGIGGRVARGRMQSSFVQSDAALAVAVERLSGSSQAGVLSSSSPSPVASDWRTAFGNVIRKLSLTDASKEAFQDGSALVGRDKERAQIMSFLRSGISGGQAKDSASLFIAGPPGVGKTVCVRSCINDLQREQARGKVSDFEFVSLNGMETRHPFEVYVHLWEKLGDKAHCTPEQASSRLEAYFTREDPDNEPNVVVVLLDEIDYLVTKNQSVLYNFFDWPTRACHHRLIVIGVSNTVNLPERLHARVQSRVGSRCLIFKAYNDKEISYVLRSKLEQASPVVKVFHEDAIIFVSKKTASISGDIRTAFHICRSASEMIMNDPKNDAATSAMVRIQDVAKVSRDSFNSPQSRAVALCTSYEALVLVALASLTRTTGRELGGFDVEELLIKMEAMASAFGDKQYLPALNLTEAMDVLSRLGEAHLVSLHTPVTPSIGYCSSLAAMTKVAIAMDHIAIMLALRGTPHHQLSQRYLTR